MDSYQFSQIHSSSAVAFSPGSTFIATAVLGQILVRSSATLDVVRTWTCTLPDSAPSSSNTKRPDTLTLDRLEWSAGGTRVLALSFKHATAWVFDLSRGQEVCRLGDVHHVEWGWEDVLAWSDRGLSFHDLSTGNSRFVQNLQSSGGHAWSPDGLYLAVVERYHAKDYVGVYDRESLVRHFAVRSVETSGMAWSPCGKWLAVWDWLPNYAIHFYSPVGVHVGTFDLAGSPEDLGQGIRRVAWAPNGRHVAIGDTEGGVHVLESESWTPVTVLHGWGKTVWREPEQGIWAKTAGITQFVPGMAPPHIPHTPVTDLGFSPDGSLLFFAHESALHVYTFLPDPSAQPEISHKATITFTSPVRATRCCPTSNRISIATRSRAVYFWDMLGVEGVDIPDGKDFTASSVVWSPDGHTAAIMGKDTFCLVYEEVLDTGDDRWEEE